MESQPKKLYRSQTNRWIGGVCGGLGDYLSMDPTVVRLLYLLVTLVTGVAPMVIVYIVMLFVVPNIPGAMTPPPPPPSSASS